VPLQPDPYKRHVESVCEKIERQKRAIIGTGGSNLRGAGIDPLEIFLNGIRQLAPSAHMDACELIGSEVAVQKLLRSSLSDTGAHVEGVMQLTARAAQSLIESKTITPREGAELIIAAALHDWGKLTTPRNILNSRDRLEGEERAIMNYHVVSSQQMADQILPPWMQNIINTIGQHHENLDGSGYPLGLKAPKLSTNSRIIRILDAFEAGIGERSYKAPLSTEKMIGNLKEEAEAGKIDARLLDALVPAMQKFGWEREQERGRIRSAGHYSRLTTLDGVPFNLDADAGEMPAPAARSLWAESVAKTPLFRDR
jgi:HD-GYP domain-containing protein (c-di-GMP phosphodiesterase class II)